MKKVTASQRAPTALAYPGTAPRANSSDPTANRTAIHHPRALGAHQVEPAVNAPGRCLRWSRESQRATTPFGRTRSTKITKGPTRPSRPPRSCTGIGASRLTGSVLPDGSAISLLHGQKLVVKLYPSAPTA